MAERLNLDTARHEGEQAVQREAGEGGEGWGSPMFDGHIPPAFGAFMQAQPMVFIGAADNAGDLWATMLAGGLGFAEALDQQTVLVHAVPGPGDALHGAFEQVRDIGMIFIDFARRRRIRVNGQAVRDGDRLVVRTSQVLGNCPKYIHPRRPYLAPPGAPGLSPVAADRLSEEDRAWIRAADTFFVSSQAEPYGADCSHRGGDPGFVTVEGDVLRWPDYLGNSFYMTFGNLTLDDRCGLLFVRWDAGELLQLTGRFRLERDHDTVARVPGALRIAEVTVTAVRRLSTGTQLRWRSPD
jgi:predicted pyridoxine 5'-phosphate oxidase superfamily flavin-nucleotide-binding protein